MVEHSASGLSARWFDQLRTAVVLCDERGAVVSLNAAAEQLCAISARQSCGRDFLALLGLPDDTRAACLEQVGRGGFTERHLAVRNAQGQELHVDLSVVPAEGGGLLFELSGVDRHLRIAREGELLAQQSATHNLLRGLAHEVKNPLGGLRGAAQLLEAEFAPSSPMREYTQVIIAEADRLRVLIDRLLGPGQTPRWERLNVHRVLERVAALLRAQAPPTLRLVCDYDPSIPPLQADHDWLLQAILNLGVNALEACEGAAQSAVQSAVQSTDIQHRITLRSRVAHHFTIGQHQHRTVVVLQVIDDGPGVAPELRDQLFYPLVTGREQGTGLGLSIAQSLVRHHGGLIEVTSQPGHTVFSIFLPLTEVQATE